jgi:hypothetical protein
MGGTLEARYDERVRELTADSGGDPDSDLVVQYIMDTVPFIKEYMSEQDQVPSSRPSRLDTFVEIVGSKSRHAVLQRYMEEVEGAPKTHPKATGSSCQNDWVCWECGQTCMVRITEEDRITCTECGVSRQYLDIGERGLTYSHMSHMKPTSHAAYKRQNHYSEWLSSLQARESTVIPDDVIQALRAEFKKSRAATRADITPGRVREYLRKLKLNKYYEHVHSITNTLNGTPPPKLSSELESRLRVMFTQIQRPFDHWVKIIAPKRKNFLSYSYVLYKFFQLLGEDQFLQYCSLLKDSRKLYQNDAIWKKICEELHWEFIPSL